MIEGAKKRSVDFPWRNRVRSVVVLRPKVNRFSKKELEIMHSRSQITPRVSLLLLASMMIILSRSSIVHGQATSYKASFKQNTEAVAVNVY